MTGQTLGSIDIHLLTTLAEKNRSIFSITDAQQILGSNFDATLQTLRRLARAGWLLYLDDGRYAMLPLPSSSIHTANSDSASLDLSAINRETPGGGPSRVPSAILAALTFAVAVVFFAFAPARTTRAASGPHGYYDDITDACSACHRTHTGRGAFVLYSPAQDNAF